MKHEQPKHRLAKHRAARRIGVRRPVVMATVGTLALAGIAGGGTGVALMGAEKSNPAPVTSQASGSSTVGESASSTAPLGAPAEVIDVAAADATRGLGSVEPDSWEQIPQAALAAYQRSAGVLAEADRRCHVEWTVLAAIGRVLTDHGEKGEHRLTGEGLTQPALIGKALRDRKGRKVADTDAGQLDGDRRHDRTVGPMLLDPTTWSSVGVDGDNDGDRNPQDVDDAALSVAVLLCSGREDLRDAGGVRSALERVNSDAAFVAAVVEIEAAYREDLKGEDPVVIEPDQSVVDAVTNTPKPDRTPKPDDEPGDDKTPKNDDDPDEPSWSDGGDPTDDPTEGPSETDTGSPTPTEPTSPTSTPDVSTSSPSATSSDTSDTASPSGTSSSAPTSAASSLSALPSP